MKMLFAQRIKQEASALVNQLKYAKCQRAGSAYLTYHPAKKSGRCTDFGPAVTVQARPDSKMDKNTRNSFFPGKLDPFNMFKDLK